MRGCETCIYYHPGRASFCAACPRMPEPVRSCDAWIAAVPEAMSMRVFPEPKKAKSEVVKNGQN